MYTPIHPAYANMEEVLRSLGSVLDAHLARRVAIRQRGGSLIVRAEVVASMAHRIDGTWATIQRTISHVDVAQATMVSAARRSARYVPGPLERALASVGRVVDEQRLHDVAVVQHTSGADWLVWHTAADGGVRLLMCTDDGLRALDTAADPEHTRAIPDPDGAPARGLSSIRWRARTIGRRPDAQPGSAGWATLMVHPNRPLLARARGFAEA